jgi:hypothetical protein
MTPFCTKATLSRHRVYASVHWTPLDRAVDARQLMLLNLAIRKTGIQGIPTGIFPVCATLHFLDCYDRRVSAGTEERS